MTFEEWKEYKMTHKSTFDFEGVKKAFAAIKNQCFDGKLQDVKFWWMPPAWEEKEPELQGLYLVDEKAVYIKMSLFDDRDYSNVFMSCIFHELAHAFCAEEGIKDTDGKKHLEAFADVCRAHGGECYWNDEKHGYNDARLKRETLYSIYEEMERSGV